MPEGDTLFRIAATLRPLLCGEQVQRFRSSVAAVASAAAVSPVVGKRICDIEPVGKNLLVHLDDGRALHTHLRMTGSWHLYRPGERWKMPAQLARAEIHVERGVAVCFNAPVVRLLTAAALRSDVSLARLGPDYLSVTFDTGSAAGRLRAYEDRPLGEAMLIQSAIAGVGNVYKSEVLFLSGFDPFAPVSAFSQEELCAAVSEAKRLLEANVALDRVVQHADSPFRTAPDPFASRRRTTRARGDGERLWVYGRQGEPCFRCKQTIAMRRQGDLGRSTYFCRGCQPARGKVDSALT